MIGGGARELSPDRTGEALANRLAKGITDPSCCVGVAHTGNYASRDGFDARRCLEADLSIAMQSIDVRDAS
jgi:hypothetical protein